jgi:hypothetical protein
MGEEKIGTKKVGEKKGTVKKQDMHHSCVMGYNLTP